MTASTNEPVHGAKVAGLELRYRLSEMHTLILLSGIVLPVYCNVINFFLILPAWHG